MDDNIPQEGVISPDFVWIKKRSGTAQHYLFDTVRGAGKDLHSDDDDPEVSSVETLKSFDSQGFTVGLTTDINDKDTTYAAWTWKAGGPAPTQTYAVTVVEDGGQKYYRFDGNSTNSIALTLQQGGTYTFDQSDSSNALGGAAHPLRFSTTSDGTHGGGSEYTVGVTTTGTPGTSGAKTVITVAWGAPTLYYYCSSHSGMGGQVNTIETRGSSNLKGSIPSIVSANTTAGFSIVSFTGNSTNPSTIGHGLSSAPEMIIYKSREATNGTWYVGHDDIGWTDRLKLDTDTTPAASSALWNNTAPTNSVFTISSSLNYNGDGIIAYCFHSVDGYCKVGSYKGNGSSSDGTFSYTGFRPAWLLVKTISSSNRWVLFDSARSTTNPVEEKHELNPDDTSSEGTSGTDCFDFLSNGFKLRRTGNVFNTSGHSYIYLAFAEAPFKFANAR